MERLIANGGPRPRRLSSSVKSVKDYLKELNDVKKEKPRQVKEAIEIYIDLWNKTIERGLVQPSDDIETALSKIDREGGLYKAAEG